MNSIFTPPASTYKREDFEGFIWIPKIHIAPTDNEKNSNKAIAQHSDENEPQLEDKPKESDNPQFEDTNNNYIPAFFQKWKGKDGESAHFTILICYGMNEDMEQIYDWARLLKDILHVNILCFDYSGYGLNKLSRKNPKIDASIPDNISEKQIYQDTTNVFTYMIDTLKIAASHIILLGRYLGTGPVIHLVSKLKGKTASGNFGKLKNSFMRLSKGGESDSLAIDPPAGIVLYSPITSVLKWIKLQSNVNTMFATDMFDNLSKAGSVKVPSYIVQGKKDPTFPAIMGKSLQEKISSVWKYLEVEDLNEDEDDFLDTFLEFLNHVAPGKTSVVKTIAAPEDSVYVSAPSQVVSRWLQQIKMEQYTDTFLTNGYFDLTLINTLEDIDLEAMGITDPVHRQAILDHAKPPQHNKPLSKPATHPFSIPPAETHPVQTTTQQHLETTPTDKHDHKPDSTPEHSDLKSQSTTANSEQISGGSESQPAVVNSSWVKGSPKSTPSQKQPDIVEESPELVTVTAQKNTSAPNHNLLFLIFFILLLFTAATEKGQ